MKSNYNMPSKPSSSLDELLEVITICEKLGGGKSQKNNQNNPINKGCQNFCCSHQPIAQAIPVGHINNYTTCCSSNAIPVQSHEERSNLKESKEALKSKKIEKIEHFHKNSYYCKRCKLEIKLINEKQKYFNNTMIFFLKMKRLTRSHVCEFSESK